MAVKKATPKSKKAEGKIFVKETHRTFALSRINYGVNSNGTKFLKGIQEGAIYSKDVNAGNVKPGIYTVVTLGNTEDEDFNLLALNRPTDDERLKCLDELKERHGNLTMSEIAESLNISLSVE